MQSVRIPYLLIFEYATNALSHRCSIFNPLVMYMRGVLRQRKPLGPTVPRSKRRHPLIPSPHPNHTHTHTLKTSQHNYSRPVTTILGPLKPLLDNPPLEGPTLQLLRRTFFPAAYARTHARPDTFFPPSPPPHHPPPSPFELLAPTNPPALPWRCLVPSHVCRWV